MPDTPPAAGPQQPRPPKATVGPLQVGKPGAHSSGCACGRRACRRRSAALPADFGRGLTGSAAAPADPET